MSGSGAGGGRTDVQRSDRCRHLVVRLSAGDALPETLLEKLRDEGVASGWLRASGVLADVALRTVDARAGRVGPARVLSGPVQALTVDGAIGTGDDGAVGCSLRAVVAREGDAGLELLGGEIQAARVLGLEVLVTALDDVELGRTLDASAGVYLLGQAAVGATRPRTWSTAVAASDDADPSRTGPGPQGTGAGSGTRMPQKPARHAVDLDSPMPEAVDLVEHFAFGPCEVVKSDGDRLHLRVQKDGRIKEIALEMLRVTPLDDAPAEGDAAPRRRFKLDRKM
jgi:predicted DNA-binding protein with PD1-like motif